MRRVAALLLLSAIGLAHTPGMAETTPAVVSGAELLYVRRGPGPNFPAFATIERGERIEVERLDGVWAMVRLASGQSGYVHSTFLSFPGEKHATIVVPATHTPTAHPPPPATQTTTPEKAAPTDPRPTLSEAAVGSLHEEVPAKSIRGQTPAPKESDSDLAALHNEIQHLTTTVDNLQRQLGDSPRAFGTPDASSEHSWLSPLGALLVVMAFLIGWVAGGAYGRQTERSRRHRIRF